MRICNVDASGKKGDERAASLSACIKK
ncbi:MAG: PsiF family protein [Simplicispira sp.]|nr:PsiF family protein [Simplicispira sp.]